MRPAGLSPSDARLAAMAELEREYDCSPPGGWAKAIEARAAWYMLPRAEQWCRYARLQLSEAKLARKRGWADREADAIKRLMHARAQWRIERRPQMAVAAE